MIARLAVLAALLGSAAGATAVLAAADENPLPKATPPAVAAQSTPAAPTPQPLKAGGVTLVRELADPVGGAAWAVRTFTADRLRCWELGRLDGDRFGWIDGYGTFTAQPPGHYKVPNICNDPKRRIGTTPQRFATLTYAAGRAPEPSRVVTFGMAADAIARIEIDGEAPIDVPEDRVYVRISAPHPFGPITGAFVRRDGKRTRFNQYDPPRGRGERPVPRTERVAVRAPDPAGGESWGVIVQRSKRGGLCFGTPERLVGDQSGFVMRDLDVFMPGFGFGTSCANRAPTRGYPLRMTTLISGVPNDEDRGRIERRVLSNRIVFWGRAHPDVVSVTIKTPRDVRTLIPTKDHFVLAVYDGQFPGGRATATARLRDGKEVTRSLYVE